MFTNEKVLIVGTNLPFTSESYKKFNLPQSTLVVDAEQDYQIGHTSLQEFKSVVHFENVLHSADIIFWDHSLPEHFPSESDYYDLLHYLKSFQYKTGKIKNFQSISDDPYSWRINTPVILSNHVVVLGCSLTRGLELESPDQCYAAILSKRLNRPYVNLGQPGGSYQKLFDIFFQIKLHPGQIIILQLPPIHRLRYCQNDRKLYDIIMSHDESKNIDDIIMTFNDGFLFYDLYTKIKAIVSFSKAMRLKLCFFMHDYERNTVGNIKDRTIFYHMPEYIPDKIMGDCVKDFGSDNLHPGPKSHQYIAQIIETHLIQLYGDSGLILS
jgi:hypothetical protein